VDKDKEVKDIPTQKAEKTASLAKWHKEKLTTALRWIEEQESPQSFVVVQGAIFICQFGDNVGNEINKTRPCLVVSGNQMNTKDGNVMVAPLTTNIGDFQRAVGYIFYQKKYPFLKESSIVKANQVRSVSRIRLTEFLGRISDEDLAKVMVRVKKVFGI
jgi:mRNA interferase MazF